MKTIIKSRANAKGNGNNFAPDSRGGKRKPAGRAVSQALIQPDTIVSTDLEGEAPLTRQRRPTHPGAILREDVLPEIGLTQGQVAALLQVSRKTVNEILQERRGMTPDMAIRIARAFGSSPEMWLGLQQDYDLWVALQDKANARVYRNIQRVA